MKNIVHQLQQIIPACTILPAETENVDTSTIGDMDAVSGMDEIIPDVEEEETDEFGEIDQELSLEDVREDEERDADDDAEEEEI